MSSCDALQGSMNTSSTITNITCTCPRWLREQLFHSPWSSDQRHGTTYVCPLEPSKELYSFMKMTALIISSCTNFDCPMGCTEVPLCVLKPQTHGYQWHICQHHLCSYSWTWGRSYPILWFQNCGYLWYKPSHLSHSYWDTWGNSLSHPVTKELWLLVSQQLVSPRLTMSDLEIVLFISHTSETVEAATTRPREISAQHCEMWRPCKPMGTAKS